LLITCAFPRVAVANRLPLGLNPVITIVFATGAEASRYRLPPGPKPVVVLSFATGAEASNRYHCLPLGPKPVSLSFATICRWGRSQLSLPFSCLPFAIIVYPLLSVCPRCRSIFPRCPSFLLHYRLRLLAPPIAISFMLVFLGFVATRCFCQYCCSLLPLSHSLVHSPVFPSSFACRITPRHVAREFTLDFEAGGANLVGEGHIDLKV